MSELATNPVQVAERMAQQHQLAQEEAAVHSFVDIADPQSMEDFSEYFAARPGAPEEGMTPREVKLAAANALYDETLADTANGYGSMSLSELVKEMAEARVAQDKTKAQAVGAHIARTARKMANSQDSDRNKDDLPEGNADLQLKNLNKRIGKWIANEADALRAAQQAAVTGPSLDKSEPQNQPTADTDDLDVPAWVNGAKPPQASAPEAQPAPVRAYEDLSKEEKINYAQERIAQLQQALPTVEDMRQRAALQKQIDLYRDDLSRLVFEGASDTELETALGELTDMTDPDQQSEHNILTGELNRRAKVARRTAEMPPVAVENDAPEAVTDKKKRTFNPGLLYANGLNKILTRMEEKAQSVPQVAESEPSEEVVDAVVEPVVAPAEPEVTEAPVAEEAPTPETEQNAKRAGFLKRLRAKVMGEKQAQAMTEAEDQEDETSVAATAEAVAVTENMPVTEAEAKRKWPRRVLIGAAAVATGVAVAWLNQKGVDINPFDGDGFSTGNLFSQGKALENPYTEDFFNYLSKTAEFKEANPSVTLPSGEVVSWIPDAPNYDLTAYDQYMHGLIDQLQS